jgi:hypothetical protein
MSPLAAASRLAPTPMQRPVAPLTDVAPPQVHFAQPPGPSTSVQPTRRDIIDIDYVVSRETVRAALEQARAESLHAFTLYMNGEVFPSNTFGTKKLNVWRDDGGHYCAAATIIRTSGRLAISEDVANTNNNLKLVDVKDGALMDWILTSGLTQQEIARIQEPFMFVGAGGKTVTVNSMTEPGVDPVKRYWETQRLLKVYKATYASLVKNEKASLDIAVDRLMAHPDLARSLMDGSLAARDVH